MDVGKLQIRLRTLLYSTKADGRGSRQRLHNYYDMIYMNMIIYE